MERFKKLNAMHLLICEALALVKRLDLSLAYSEQTPYETEKMQSLKVKAERRQIRREAKANSIYRKSEVN